MELKFCKGLFGRPIFSPKLPTIFPFSFPSMLKLVGKNLFSQTEFSFSQSRIAFSLSSIVLPQISFSREKVERKRKKEDDVQDSQAEELQAPILLRS